MGSRETNTHMGPLVLILSQSFVVTSIVSTNLLHEE